MVYQTLCTLLDRMFAIDLRSLASFRISIALILLFDLVIRSFSLMEHYTDWGVMPLEALSYYQRFMWIYSFHTLSGSPFFIGVLFLIQGLIAICFMIGYRSWLMNFLSWILLCSLFNRNEAVLSGADALLRALLFWSLFLPLGAKFSVDSLLSDSSDPMPKKVLSGGSAAILLQICLMYWISVVYKWNPDWLEGKSLYYALNIDQFVTDWGKWLRLHPRLMEMLTYGTLGGEIFGPLLALLPFRNRSIRQWSALIMIVLHFGFGMMLYLGIFSYVAVAGWILFLPSEFWDTVLRSEQKGSPSEDQEILKKFNPFSPQWNLCFSLFIFANVFAWNIYVLRGKTNDQIPFLPKEIIKIFQLYQTWNMFSRPMREDGWFIIVGKLISGKVVDIGRKGAEIEWEKPKDVAATYPDSRWRKYMMNLTSNESSHFLPYYCKWWCRKWNQSHYLDNQLEMVQVIYMLEMTQENHIDQPKKVVLYTHYCD